MPIAIAAQIERDTRALSLPKGRRVGQPGHDTAKAYLLERMSELGLEPHLGDSLELPYTPLTGSWREFAFSNLVGRIPGRDPSLEPALVGAHYDSVIDAPCSDDNATAVAVALAVAEVLRPEPLERDVIIALFDAEEPPFFLSPSMGSIRFYEDQRNGLDFHAVIIMDLIGHDVEPRLPIPGASDGLADLLVVLGAESDASLPAVVERAAVEVSGLKVLPSLNRYVGDLSDHHAFRLGSQPYLFLTCGQGRCYHEHCDTPEWVNFEKVFHVFEYVIALLRGADGGSTQGAPGPPTTGPNPTGPDAPDTAEADPPEFDTTAFEIRMMREALGPVLEVLLAESGGKLEGRADIDRVVRVLAGQLLG